jgi:hypothetical protein
VPRYELNRLGSGEFENLVQAILKNVIGSGTITFGTGADGGREATFDGAAPYPSRSDQWAGLWIFQAKYHDIELLGTRQARKDFIADVDEELDKLINKYGRKFDNYIIATNVPLSPTPNSGTIDQIHKKVFPKYRESVRNLAVWGADEICRFLDNTPEIKRSYLQFITPGELIAELLTHHERQSNEVAITLRSYLSHCYRREQYAQLDQAGDVSEQPVRLQQVFFELESSVPQSEDLEPSERSGSHRAAASFSRRYRSRAKPGTPILPTAAFLLSDGAMRVVLVGGPGEGKSTVGQYLSQLHRAVLLGRANEIGGDNHYSLILPRIPLRVILREFGQWLSNVTAAEPADDSATLDHFICGEIRRSTARSMSTEQLHRILQDNPTLLILDGLDEVTDSDLRRRLLAAIDDFVDRAERVLRADLQVFATTRPTGYSNQFNPKQYLHLRLVALEPPQVRKYVARWAEARNLESAKSERVISGIEECLADHQVQLLSRTPLQVTILVLIIATGGTPPRQREALFNEYLEVIYKREQAKSKNLLTSKKELLVGLHKYVGYELHERATRPSATGAELDRDEYVRKVDLFLSSQDPYSPTSERKKVTAAITTEAGERLVLIVEPAANRFGFELRSIQEFFAALHLCDTARDTGERYARFEAIARLPHWRNVVLFFAGRVGRLLQGETSAVVEVCRQVDREGLDAHLRRGAQLALAIANDQAFLPNRRMQRSVIEVAISLLEQKHTQHALAELIEALSSLPAEDIRDHVVPLLRSRSRLIAPERADELLCALAILDPSSVEALDLLSRVADVEAAQTRCLGAAFAIALARPEAIDIARELADRMSLAAIGEALDGPFSWAPARPVMTRIADGAEQSIKIKLVRAAGSRLMQSVRPSYVESPDIWNEYLSAGCAKNGIQAYCDILQAAAVSKWLCERPTRGPKPDADAIDKLQSLRQLLPVEVLCGDIGNAVKDWLGTDEPALGAPLWALHMLLGDVSERSCEQFRQFLTASSEDSFANRSFTRSGEAGILDYVIAQWHAKRDDAWSTMNEALLEFGGLDGYKRLRDVRTDIEAAVMSIAPRDRRRLLSREDGMRECLAQSASLRSIRDRFGDDLLQVLVVGTRPMPRRYDGVHIEHAVEEIIQSPVLTSARRRTIVNLCLRSRDSDPTRAEAQRQILEYLSGIIDDSRAASIFPEVLAAWISNGAAPSSDVRNYLRLLSNMTPDEKVLRVWRESNRFYSTLMPILTDRSDLSVCRGAALLVIGAGYSRSDLFSSTPPTTFRFAGFSALHRAAASSADPLIRAAAISVFFARRPTGRAAEQLLKGLIVKCETSVEERLITALCTVDLVLADRLSLWRGVIESLLGERLYGDLGALFVERMSQLLESDNQSLALLEPSLNLPLGSFD